MAAGSAQGSGKALEMGLSERDSRPHDGGHLRGRATTMMDVAGTGWRRLDGSLEARGPPPLTGS